MSIPIGENEKGAFYKITDKWACFVREGTWSYDYAVQHGSRVGTYAEFKELYPYDNGTSRSRSTEKTKYNAKFNK